MMSKRPVVLAILDGWGYSERVKHNAIASAKTPIWDDLWQNNPHILIGGSGEAVGLPAKQMGNSEVGHMNIGAGRVVYQDFTRINQAASSMEWRHNAVLKNCFAELSKSNKCLHIVGLLSPGGVHSHEDHMLAMIELAREFDCPKLACHAFLDGRDTPPRSASASIERMEQTLKAHHYPPVSSIIGRYYAMDRDNRWDRINKAYCLLTEGHGELTASSAISGLEKAYALNHNDEFVPPTWITGSHSIEDGDAILFMNFRADRARQITRAFTELQFDRFERTKLPKLNKFISLTEYASDLETEVVFPPVKIKNSLGEYLARLGMQQLRIAETEKYAHVTFFFNGGAEEAYPGEDRMLVNSPKVAHYDLQPEMSAHELTAKLTAAIKSNQYDFIVCNYANPDMVGHTGNFTATVQAIEAIDTCLKKLVDSVKEVDGDLLITADHGNAECMFDEVTNQAHTAHTNLPVPLVHIGRLAHFHSPTGALCDIAPTILGIMALPQPQEMTGQCLLHFDV